MNPVSFLSPADGRALIAAQVHAARSDSDRALRAYFLCASDARRMKRAGMTGEAGLAAVRLSALGQASEPRPGALSIVGRACFAAIGDILRPAPAPSHPGLIARVESLPAELRP